MFSLVYISVPPNSYNSLQHYHIYSTYIRTVPPIPITHFSITTYAYVHIEATYVSVPPRRQTHFSIYTYTVRQGQTPIQSSSNLRSKKQPSKTYARITYTQTRRTFREPIVLTVTPSVTGLQRLDIEWLVLRGLQGPIGPKRYSTYAKYRIAWLYSRPNLNIETNNFVKGLKHIYSICFR